MKKMAAVTVAVFVTLVGAEEPRRGSEVLAISDPARDGVTAACRVTIKGQAMLGPGEHAWAFASRNDFAELGLVWLSGELPVDAATNAYSMPITLGVSEDIGSNFRVSVGIVDDATHMRLRNKFIEMMTNNRHLPIPFPQTVSAPRHRTVKKVSHEGC